MFDSNKYTNISSKGCVVEDELEDPKYLQGLHSDYPLSWDKIEHKEEMLSDYQSKIADIYDIPTGNVKNFMLNLLGKKTYMTRYEKLQFYLRVGLKLKSTWRTKIQSIAMAKTIFWIQ